MPDEREALGLLALMTLHDARRGARTDADGELVLLADQDRARWDAAAIAQGRRWSTARSPRRPGRYVVQAAIVATHLADGPAPTGAPISRSYDRLVGVQDTPVVRLNRAVAVAMADGPPAGLALADERRRRSTPTTCCTPPAPSCCAGSAGARRPRPRTSAPSRWPPTRSSARSWSAGARSCVSPP